VSLVGTTVGGIRVLASLGEGGMGEVYVGLDEKLERRVALKAIRADRRPSASARARFVREARILSSLDHPHICRIHGYLEGEAADLLVLELVEGQRLDQAMAKGLDRGTRLRVAEEIAEALAAAHERGIVHRDLKPQNVMLTPAGGVKVLDFGLAAPVRLRRPASGAPPASDGGAVDGATETSHPTLASPAGDDDVLATRQGALVGTPAYMSPEQARGEELTTASDLYAFGLLLQELFTGRPPFPETLDAASLVERARRAETLPLEGVDRGTAALVGRLLAAAPAARPTAVDTLAALRRLREAPRRRRRLAAAAALGLTLALAAVKYVVDLRAARAEAERRRTQAEDLIGFMLGDLRKKLESVGRLEILDDVGAKAMDYFAAVPASSLSDEELLRRSVALYQIGTVRIARGQLEAAAGPLHESLALARALHERRPEDTARLFELGQSHFWVGFVHWRRRELEAALADFRAYLDVARRLVAADPGNADWQAELSMANSNIGSVLEEQGDLAGALERFQASLAIDRALLDRKPGDATLRRAVAASNNTVGTVLRAQGRLDEALAHHRAELALQEELVRQEPGTAEWRLYLGVSREYVAGILEAQGRLAPALELLESALSIFEALTRSDPANMEWQRELGKSHYRLGLALGAAREDRRAFEHARQAVAILARTAATEASDAGWQRDLAEARNALAQRLCGGGDLDGAGGEARAALAIADRILEHSPDDRQSLRIRSTSLALLAQAEEWRGAAKRAAVLWSQAAAAVEPVARGSSDSELLVPWALALAGLGRRDDARAVVDRLADMGYRHPAVVRLAASRGLRWPDARREDQPP
jgi:serine/threonine-protein kinase